MCVASVKQEDKDEIDAGGGSIASCSLAVTLFALGTLHWAADLVNTEESGLLELDKLMAPLNTVSMRTPPTVVVLVGATVNQASRPTKPGPPCHVLL